MILSMNIKNTLAAIWLCLSFSALADPSIPSAYFDTVGAVDSFQWAPERYEKSFESQITKYSSGLYVLCHK